MLVVASSAHPLLLVDLPVDAQNYCIQAACNNSKETSCNWVTLIRRFALLEAGDISKKCDSYFGFFLKNNIKNIK